MVVFRLVHDITSKYRIIRGVVAYAILWPIGCLMQQTLIEKRSFKDWDWQKCLRYSAYGALFNGPTLYLWIRVASRMWPRSDIRSSIAKAITEQIAYDPFAISIFLYSMARSEGKSKEDAWHEVTSKFIPTYQVGFIYWPIVQTVNFSVVPQKNQVIVAGFFSLFWTTFLACVKHLDVEPKPLKPHQIKALEEKIKKGEIQGEIVTKK